MLEVSSTHSLEKKKTHASYFSRGRAGRCVAGVVRNTEFTSFSVLSAEWTSKGHDICLDKEGCWQRETILCRTTRLQGRSTYPKGYMAGCMARMCPPAHNSGKGNVEGCVVIQSVRRRPKPSGPNKYISRRTRRLQILRIPSRPEALKLNYPRCGKMYLPQRP